MLFNKKKKEEVVTTSIEMQVPLTGILFVLAQDHLSAFKNRLPLKINLNEVTSESLKSIADELNKSVDTLKDLESLVSHLQDKFMSTYDMSQWVWIEVDNDELKLLISLASNELNRLKTENARRQDGADEFSMSEDEFRIYTTQIQLSLQQQSQLMIIDKILTRATK
jgi:hypothetical protein